MNRFIIIFFVFGCDGTKDIKRHFCEKYIYVCISISFHFISLHHLFFRDVWFAINDWFYFLVPTFLSSALKSNSDLSARLGTWRKRWKRWWKRFHIKKNGNAHSSTLASIYKAILGTHSSTRFVELFSCIHLLVFVTSSAFLCFKIHLNEG